MSSESRGGAGFEAQEVSYKQVLLIYFLIQFGCWILLEFLEHKCHMQPAIRRRSSFSRMADLQTSNTIDRKNFVHMSRRITKSLGI